VARLACGTMSSAALLIAGVRVRCEIVERDLLVICRDASFEVPPLCIQQYPEYLRAHVDEHV
jgi:hypothetical protein